MHDAIVELNSRGRPYTFDDLREVIKERITHLEKHLQRELDAMGRLWPSGPPSSSERGPFWSYSRRLKLVRAKQEAIAAARKAAYASDGEFINNPKTGALIRARAVKLLSAAAPGVNLTPQEVRQLGIAVDAMTVESTRGTPKMVDPRDVGGQVQKSGWPLLGVALGVAAVASMAVFIAHYGR